MVSPHFVFPCPPGGRQLHSVVSPHFVFPCPPRGRGQFPFLFPCPPGGRQLLAWSVPISISLSTRRTSAASVVSPHFVFPCPPRGRGQFPFLFPCPPGGRQLLAWSVPIYIFLSIRRTSTSQPGYSRHLPPPLPSAAAHPPLTSRRHRRAAGPAAICSVPL